MSIIKFKRIHFDKGDTFVTIYDGNYLSLVLVANHIFFFPVSVVGTRVLLTEKRYELFISKHSPCFNVRINRVNKDKRFNN